jgi:glycine betaine/proline transport system ATP-binding protein
MPAVEFKKVDIIFGTHWRDALEMLDDGKSREQILERTGQVLGVADASISVEKGEICVLMGLSGSGKSTLLRAVNGLNKVTRGNVMVDDGAKITDVANCDPATLRKLRMNSIAMVFQQFALLPWRTVRENVGLGLELSGVPAKKRHETVSEKLKMVGLEQWQNKYAHELSGGMQQRVGLARAFATDANILLMDEPFSALDPLIRNRLQDELLDLQNSLHKTILFVSHDLDEALKIGNRIAIMESGRIVQYGSAEEIVLAPANQYVADFVAHMNPLNVLRGSTLMTAADKIERKEQGLNLDRSGRYVLQVDGSNQIIGALVDGQPVKIVHYSPDTNLNTVSESNDVMISASSDILMKTAIEIRHATGYPVALIEDNKFAGVIGDDEIYRGMLQQSEINLAH